MRKLLLLLALVAMLAALLPVTALAVPGKSGNRNDDSQYCYYNGTGFVVQKDEHGTC